MTATQDQQLHAVTSNNVVLESEVVPATIVYSPATGKIVSIIRKDEVISAAAATGATIDETEFYEEALRALGVDPENHRNLEDLVLMPGIVDSHVHLNERKLAAAENQCWVDVGFWGGIVPDNAADLVPLVNAGVRGFKCFMIESGVDEFPAVEDADIMRAMQTLRNEKTIVMFHAEKDCTSHNHGGAGAEAKQVESADQKQLDPATYDAFLTSRPDDMELAAIRTVIKLSATAPELPLHIVHLASAEALPTIAAAQAAGVPLSVETCFHYLTFAAENIPPRATQYKCCPPIRAAANNEALWDALLRTGEIGTVVSDHSPCTPVLKDLENGDYMQAWGGISSVGLGLPILWTGIQKRTSKQHLGNDGTNTGFVSFADIARWICANTAKQVGLFASKGSIAVGKDADFCIFDPNDTLIVDQSVLPFKNKLTPYHGSKLNGLVRETILRGRTVFSVTDGHVPVPTGALLLEKRTV
ncbi:hypothetical protein DV454_001018 [Geotrichum candidum]|nr:hypothetical protein DV454_001018 [Geotrichum candidum]